MQFPVDIKRDAETARPAGLEAEMVRRSWMRLLGWSVVIHGIPLIALAVTLSEGPVALETDPVIAVDLVALAQSAPAAAPSPPAAPASPPQAEVKPAPPVERRPRPEPAPVKTQTPVTKPEPAPQPSPPQQAAASAQPAPDTAPAQALAAPSPARSGPAGGTSTGSQAAAKASYARLLLTRLQRAIVYPRRAQRRGVEGVVRLEVVLAASGQLRSVRLVGTSGQDVLDDAALKLVRRVAPFPPVPGDLAPGGRDFAFVAPIQYRLN